MKALQILGVDSLDEVTRNALDLSFEKTFDILSEFAVDGAFLSKIETVFGSDYDAEKLEQLRQDFASNNLDWIPKFEIHSAAELKGANAAFAAANNTVYLSQSFISNNNLNSQRITDVLLEELGHLIDSTINIEDTFGDEGEYFSHIARDIDLPSNRVDRILQENDQKLITLDKSSKFPVEAQNSNPDIIGKLYVGARDLASVPIGTHQFLTIEIFNLDENLSSYLEQEYANIQFVDFGNSTPTLDRKYIVIGAHNVSNELKVKFSETSDLDATKEKFTGERDSLTSWDPEFHEVKLSTDDSVSSDLHFAGYQQRR